MATIEQRVAALESKLNSLTATTPTSYYVHRYSGEEIDDILSHAAPGGEIDINLEGKAPAGLIEYTVRCATDEEINEALETAYMASKDKAIKYFCMNVVENGLSLSGGIWVIALSRVSSDYGFLTAMSYVKSQILTRSKFGGIWLAWSRIAMA